MKSSKSFSLNSNVGTFAENNLPCRGGWIPHQQGINTNPDKLTINQSICDYFFDES